MLPRLKTSVRFASELFSASIALKDDDDNAPLRPPASRMATTARQTAMERFATDRIIPQYEAYYEQVMGRAARAEN